VRVAARHPDPEFTRSGAIEFSRTDVRDDSDVAGALAGASAAVNAVSLYIEQRDADFETIHVDAARRIARISEENGIARLVHISGIGVDTASPSAYVRARARGEDAVTEGFPGVAILRPSAIVSARGGMLEALEGITRLPVVPLFDDGSVLLQPVDVADVAQAVREALQREKQGIFELGGAEVLSYRQLLQAVMASADRRRPMLAIPMRVWRGIARVLSVLPSPPLTRDQLVLLSRDKVVAPDARGFEDLGLVPRGVRSVLRERAGQN